MKKEYTILQNLGLFFSKTKTKNFNFQAVQTKEGEELQLMDGLYIKDGQPVTGEYTLILEDGSEKKIILKDGVEEVVEEIAVEASEDMPVEVVAPAVDEMKSIMEAIKMLAGEIDSIKSQMQTSKVEMESKFESAFKPKENKETKVITPVTKTSKYDFLKDFTFED
jgi:hypothetical protein